MPFRSLTIGVLTAFAAGHPKRNLAYMVLYGTPLLSAQTESGRVSPWIAKRTLPLLFLFCVRRSAHLQFPGSYPLLLSMRSIDIPIAGSPISATKFANFSHRSHTLIPRPP